MKVKYVGDPNDNYSGADEITAFGQKFIKNKTVDVKVDEATALKIAGNSHFEVTPTKGDKNNARTAADQVDDAGDEALLGSTTGDPETATREQLIAQNDRKTANEPMGEPGPKAGK